MKKSILSLVTCITLASSSLAIETKVYATVNGDKITSSDIAVALRDPRIKFDSLPKSQQDNILNSLIEQKLLSQEALKTKIPTTKEYKEELKKLKQTLAFQIWMRNLSSDVKVDDKEAKEFYNQNKMRFNKPLELKASHILVKTKAEADTLIKTLSKASNKKAKFTELAKTKSTGPSGTNGGELGWFTKDKMVPEFSEAASKLSKGSFTKEPVQTQFGFHVIFLDDKKQPTTATFAEVKTGIIQQISQKKFFDILKNKAQKLKKNAKIQYN